MPIEILRFKNSYGPEQRFSERQKEFEETSNKAVDWGFHTITNTPKNRDDITRLFHELLKTFAQARQATAIRAGTLEAEKFGQTYDESEGDALLYTPLVGRYEEINKRVLNDLYRELNPLKRTKREFLENTKKTTEVALGRKFSCEFQILSHEDLTRLHWINPLSKKQNQEILRITRAVLSPEIPLQRQLSKVAKIFQAKFPTWYMQDKMYHALTVMNQAFPSPNDPNAHVQIPGNMKSDFILVTMNTEINGKMIPTNRIFTWAYRNYREDPLQTMVEHSKVFILHPDPLQREESLQEAERLFVEIVEKGKMMTEQDLKEKMALFRYVFAQGMPFQRGSAAIGEWIEKSTYRHFGFTCTQTSSSDTVDLAALTSFHFREYLEKYNELIQLARIEYQKKFDNILFVF